MSLIIKLEDEATENAKIAGDDTLMQTQVDDPDLDVVVWDDTDDEDVDGVVRDCPCEHCTAMYWFDYSDFYAVDPDNEVVPGSKKSQTVFGFYWEETHRRDTWTTEHCTD